jgi:L-threonylcarbamoyladenylate synthase
MQEEIKEAVAILKKGGIILYPSDTIWGIGCDAQNRKAIGKLFKLKKRDTGKQMIILANSLEEVSRYVKTIPEVVPDLLKIYLRPLTIIYPGAINLPDNLTGKDKTIAIRVVRNTLCESIIHGLGNPIVSTSANVSGNSTPLTFSMIEPEIVNGVDYILQLRQEGVTEMKPSTIIQVEQNNQIRIIRE